MSLDSHVSRRRRGLSPEINPIAETGRRNIVLSTQKSALSRTFSPLPIVHNMTYSGALVALEVLSLLSL